MIGFESREIERGGVLPFEAVIRVKVAGGVPVITQLVAVHGRK